ncbi:XdhC family protein [Nostoc sp.]|uniref:XdhC family protein n=1 Tax=Nostoc sp. TaxID=1180 RepID=UPI002FF9BF4E
MIIGAGHIAISLRQIAKIAGFQVIVQDDRADFATKKRFPEASLVLAKPITSIQKILNINTKCLRRAILRRQKPKLSQC